MAEERILCLHPQGKQGVNILRSKYEAVRGAILRVVEEEGVMYWSDLTERCAALLPDFEGSLGWYVVSVKLDLEARGVIERLPGSGKQRIQLRQPR